MLLKNLNSIKHDIDICCDSVGRNKTDILLLAVSKKQSVENIRLAIDAGQLDFGENFLQEALDKMQALSNLDIDLPVNSAIVWHYIGAIQSNKTNKIANNFSWVHSVDSLKIATRLSAQNLQTTKLNICLQINIDNEATKSGFELNDDFVNIAKKINQLPNINLRGLMCIPNPMQSDADKKLRFKQMRQLLEKLNNAGLNLDTLSMGMSDDFRLAIEQGATIIRIGTAIFGDRNYD